MNCTCVSHNSPWRVAETMLDTRYLFYTQRIYVLTFQARVGFSFAWWLCFSSRLLSEGLQVNRKLR